MPTIGNPVGGPKHKPQWMKDREARNAPINAANRILADQTRAIAQMYEALRAVNDALDGSPHYLPSVVTDQVRAAMTAWIMEPAPKVSK